MYYIYSSLLYVYCVSTKSIMNCITPKVDYDSRVKLQRSEEERKNCVKIGLNSQIKLSLKTKIYIQHLVNHDRKIVSNQLEGAGDSEKTASLLMKYRYLY